WQTKVLGSDFEEGWRKALHDGVIAGSAFEPKPAPGVKPLGKLPDEPSGNLSVVFAPDPTLWDGRFANNGWLQELPKPLTKLTWDPSAWVSPALADQQKLRDGDIIELKYRGNTAKLPVAIVPGHPDGAVTAFLGYGRQVPGR